ncbi:MAG: RNA polymerase sigma factor [Eubacteriales bacterium]
MIDAEILAMLISRDENGVNTIEKEYGNYIKTIASRVVTSKEDVEECLNDSLLKLWHTIPPVVPKSLKAYIGTVARNIALDCYRKQNTVKRKAEFAELLEEIQQSENPESVAVQQEVTSCIDRYLTKISKEKRFLFLGRYYYGYTIAELSKKRNLSESKVKSILFRMRKELKIQLEKDGVWE